MSILYREEDLESRFEFLVERYVGKKVLLYGASNFLKTLIQRFDFSKFDIVGIADRNFYRGENFAGWDTYNYEDIKDLDYDVCLITIFNSLERVESGFKTDGIEFESFVSKDFIEGIETYNNARFQKIVEHYRNNSDVTFEDLETLQGLDAQYCNQTGLAALFPHLKLTECTQSSPLADYYFVWSLKYIDCNYLISKRAFDNGKPLCVFETGFLSSVETWANDYALPEYKQNISFTVSNGVCYFDATCPNSLEKMLNDKNLILPEEQKQRARNCINAIVNNKLSKYNSQPIYAPSIGREGAKKILVVDQSYGDASIEKGLANDETFVEMLDAAVRENPDADIIIKTHPDTKTGTRKGYYTGYEAKDNIYLLTEPINPISLIEYVDEVYVCTSQFGFEALMCGKPVHTFGVPFYAGWGLTDDRQKCVRRTNRRTLEEVFYLAYITYSRYINPLKSSPCEIEDAIEYLIQMREKYFTKPEILSDIKKVCPTSLFSHKRLDLVVKYLYAKEILEKPFNDYCTDVYKDLYIRHILMRTLGEEPPTGEETSGAKNDIRDYLTKYEALIKSIGANGYSPEQPIPFDILTGLPANGAHRIAAAAALDKDVYITNADKGYDWDFDWFEENGFSTEDKQRILKGFVDINAKDCAIFVVWNPLFNYLDNVRSMLKKDFDIVGEIELDFEDNYVAFTNALLDIYHPNIGTGDATTILEKSKILQACYLSFKVIVVKTKSKSERIDILVKSVKTQIREFFNHILPKECFCTVHSSDGESECRYLASILLSPNNIRYLKLRPECDLNSAFTRRIANLPNFLTTIGVFDHNDICVVGSGTMSALGIQKDSDSDFITVYKHRDRLGWDIVYLNDDYDIAKSDKVANRPKDIADDILVYNDEYHFRFKGIKFANLEIIKDRKRFSNRSKDKMHLRLIDLWEKMVGARNQRKLLFERIEVEKERRRTF